MYQGGCSGCVLKSEGLSGGDVSRGIIYQSSEELPEDDVGHVGCPGCLTEI